MSLAEEWARDFAFVHAEIERFRRLDPRVLLRAHGDDIDYVVPGPAGDLICGRAAGVRLGWVSDAWLARSRNRNRLDPAEFRRCLKQEFSRKFLAGGAEIDARTAQQVLSAAERASARSFINLTHYIPCHIVAGEEPASLAIGPVTFRPRRILLQALSADLDDYRTRSRREILERAGTRLSASQALDADPDGVANRTIDQLISGLNATFSNYAWVAEVTVCGCAPSVSRRRAAEATVGALNVLRLILGAYHTERMRAADNPLAPLEGAELTRDAAGHLDISLSRMWPGHALGANWANVLRSKEAAPRVEAAGRALAVLTDPPADPTLAERFIDALRWYGEGVVEASAAAKVVKFMTAIERMVLGDTETGVTEAVIGRAAALCTDLTPEDHGRWRSLLHDLYGARSKLVHGAASPFDPAFDGLAWRAGDAARHVLLRGLDIFVDLGLSTKVSPRRLRTTLAEHVTRITNVTGINAPATSSDSPPARLRPPWVRAAFARIRPLRVALAARSRGQPN